MTKTIQSLTVEQASIITAFTGVSAGPFVDFQIYAEQKLGRPIMTHEFGLDDVWIELREVCREDFLSLCAKI